MRFNFNVVAATAAMICAFLIGGCTKQTTPNAEATNKTTTTTTKTTTNTASEKPATGETAKTEAAPAGDSVGVAECDEYIKKYEACLTKIAANAPAAQGPLKQAFEAQRNGFKSAASTPQGKATLVSTCKQAIETAKASTKAYSCEW
jgi:hypothetical protein